MTNLPLSAHTPTFMRDDRFRIEKICALNELRINNTFFQHKPQHKFTFENTRGQKSIIDYIITNRNIHPSQVLDVRALSSANAVTNHNLVMAKIRVTTYQIKKKQNETTSKLNMEALANYSTKHLYQQSLKQKIANNGMKNDDGVEMA
ncbi:hypothetical protein HUJ05_007578 [Dendroctonus ponderosae]|nr:hypothetical protein HUJ05_007578 [Dendroctonus ponderosae]